MRERNDELTGLLTREQFMVAASEILQRAEENGTVSNYSILYTNIRHFKNYNVKYGVEEGDKVLKHWAYMLMHGSNQDLHARFGSDHFISLTTEQDLANAVKLSYDYFEQRYGSSGIQMKIGVFRFEHPGVTIEKACDLAKFACDALRNQSGYLCFYDQQMKEKLELESYVIQNLDRVLREKKIEVYYQPVIRTINGNLCGLEALSRWKDTGIRELMPSQYIPALEKNQFIAKLDLYVLDEVCRLIREKIELGYINVPVSLNLSRMDFLACDIFKEVERTVAKYGIARDILCLEITESVVMGDHENIKRQLKRFRDAGYQIWMDDFGSGYSSLNVLQEFDVDEIKLDMHFLEPFNQKSKQMMRSIISMVKELQIKTLAEGVETQEQFNFLRSIGCDKVQGFLFSPPVEAQKIRFMYEGHEEQIETRLWHKFYARLGEINFITDRALSIREYDGRNFRVLYSNEAYDAVLKEIGVPETVSSLELINSQASPLWILYRELLDRLVPGGDYEEIEFPLNEQYVRLRMKLLSVEQEHRLCCCELINLTRGADAAKTAEWDHVSRMMYGMYDTVYVIDLEKQCMNPIIPGSNHNRLMAYGIPENGSIAEIGRIADAVIFWEDRKAFLEFMDLSNVMERIRLEEKNYITMIFRTRKANGAYVWSLHTLQMVPGRERVIYSMRYVPHLYEQMLEKAGRSEQQLEADLPYFHALVQSNHMSVFWKDTNRRFIGANKRFLEMFGLADVSEIIGKTDEDMKWNIDADPFREDEFRVLQQGQSIVSRIGRCLIKGVVHKIVAIKEPVYENGQLVGLVGTFLSVDDLTSYLNLVMQQDKTDALTGLMSVQEIANAATQYAESWEFEKEPFAVITLSFHAYQRSEQTYGRVATREIVKRIGQFIGKEASSYVSAGRLFGDKFVLLARYKERVEIDWIIQSISRQCQEIHELGGYDVTLDPEIHSYFCEDTEDVRELISIATGGYLLDHETQKRMEQKRSIDILSHVPAAIALFSVSETHEIQRLFLSEQAKKYAHIPESGDSSLNELVSVVHPADRSYVYQCAHQAAAEMKPADMEFRVIAEDGTIYWDRLIIMPYTQKDGTQFLYGVYSDITDLKKRSEELRRQSLTDGLTGLKNRHALREDFEELKPGIVSMVMIDIDHFKLFNDNFGHDIGDQVIVACAEQIKLYFPYSNCYRYGGDEYLIVSTDLRPDEVHMRMSEMTRRIASQRIREDIPEIQISFGILTDTFDSLEHLREILKKADNLLYEQKHHRDQKIRTLKTQNHLLMDSIPGALRRSNIGQHPHVIYVNKGFTYITGYTLEMIQKEYDGKFINLLYDETDVKHFVSTVHHAQNKNKFYNLSYRMRHRDGHILYISERISSYVNEAGESEILAVMLETKKNGNSREKKKVLLWQTVKPY